MKQKVENPDSDPQLAETIPLLAKALPPGNRWVWFLELAVERYVFVMDGHSTDHKLPQVPTLGCEFRHIRRVVHPPSN